MDDIGEFLTACFPNFTSEMYEGNVPCGKGHELVSGGYSDRWSTKFGGGETVNTEILHFSFSLNHKITIHIVGDILNICDIRYSGKSDVWCYCNKPENGMIFGCSNKCLHELEPEKIEQFLNTKIPNCKIWTIVQSRAKELYYQK